MALFQDPIADLESLLVADGAGQAEVDADEHARVRIFFRRVRNAVERAWADGRKRRRHRAGESEGVFVTEERDEYRCGSRAGGSVAGGIIRDGWGKQERFPGRIGG